MATAVTQPVDRQVAVRGLQIHVRHWAGAGRPFVLVHGLASNCMTWEGAARLLAAAGHQVVTVDQRGHGLSSKPDTGYGFDDVTADLQELIAALDLTSPVIAGQSWGGNVVLDFAARHPEVIAAIALVDGGYIDLQSMPGATWEVVEAMLRPPALTGTPRVDMEARMRGYHADWLEEGIQHSLANFETLPDGTIRPWLTLDRHLQILRALWDQRVADIYPKVQAATLIMAADSGPSEWQDRKRDEVAVAERLLPVSRVAWFENTDHDIHVQRPQETANLLLNALKDGFFRG